MQQSHLPTVPSLSKIWRCQIKQARRADSEAHLQPFILFRRRGRRSMMLIGQQRVCPSLNWGLIPIASRKCPKARITLEQAKLRTSPFVLQVWTTTGFHCLHLNLHLRVQCGWGLCHFLSSFLCSVGFSGQTWVPWSHACVWDWGGRQDHLDQCRSLFHLPVTTVGGPNLNLNFELSALNSQESSTLRTRLHWLAAIDAILLSISRQIFHRLWQGCRIKWP